jgi:hypothetical protein
MPAASVSQLFAPCRFGFSGETKNVCGIMQKKNNREIGDGQSALDKSLRLCEGASRLWVGQSCFATPREVCTGDF